MRRGQMGPTSSPLLAPSDGRESNPISWRDLPGATWGDLAADLALQGSGFFIRGTQERDEMMDHGWTGRASRATHGGSVAWI